MKTFKEWLNEAYGFGTETEEKLDYELYGIRETLKNALAQGSLVYRWGDLEQRIRKLQRGHGIDTEKLRRVLDVYSQIITPITSAYQELSRSGIRGEPNVHNPEARQQVQFALKQAWQSFDGFQKLLRGLSSPSSQHGDLI